MRERKCGVQHAAASSLGQGQQGSVTSRGTGRPAGWPNHTCVCLESWVMEMSLEVAHSRLVMHMLALGRASDAYFLAVRVSRKLGNDGARARVGGDQFVRFEPSGAVGRCSGSIESFPGVTFLRAFSGGVNARSGKFPTGFLPFLLFIASGVRKEDQISVSRTR